MNNNYKEQYAYSVFKYNVYDSNFLICRTDELPNTGFSSLYSITNETAETLQTAGIAGYKGAVWSPQLALDFDNEEQAMEARRRLSSSGLAYEVWSTGNRGLHFYIDRPHAPAHNLPQIDKVWVKSNFPQADLSIYSNLHMFRVAGARHVKTGRIKTLLERVEGEPLILADQLESQSDTRHLLGPLASRSIFDDQKVMNWTVPWEDGKRHEALLNLGLYMKRCGESIEFIARWLYHANLLNAVPKSSDELERIVAFVAESGATSENI